MKKGVFGILGVLFISCFISGVSAEYRVYTDMVEFEKAKGAICEAATDGCNKYFMKDGKVMGGTKMYCENHKVEWNCTKYKEDTITTMTVGLDEVTTTREDVFSENDRSFYETIQERLDSKYQERVDKVITSYKKKLSKYSSFRQKKANDRMIMRLEEIISRFLLKFPADTALSEKNNNTYLMLTLLKFKLRLLDL